MTRTALALMAFGFAIERFALFVAMLGHDTAPHVPERGLSFWTGIGLIALGSLSVSFAIVQYRRVLRTLRPIEIPEGYMPALASWTSAAVALIGLALIANLFGA